MSFTLSIFDSRRSGLKVPYCLPSRQVTDDRRHEFVSPFRWTKEGLGNPRPAFLQTLAAPASQVDTKVQHLRGKALRVFANHSGGVDCLIRYHEALREFDRIVRACAPTGDIDPSLPNHEQDRLYEEREAHSMLAEVIQLEQTKLLYNTALFLAREAYKTRFSAEENTVVLFQQAAAIFDLVANSPYLPEEGVPSELAPDFLRVMALNCLAGAAEHMLMKRVENEVEQWEPCAHLCFSISYYYSQLSAMLRLAKKMMERAAGVSSAEAMVNLATVKSEYYRGATWWHLAHDPTTRRGEQRRRKAIHAYEAALAHLSRFLPGMRKAVETEIEHRIRVARHASHAAAAASFPGDTPPSGPADATPPFERRPTPTLQLPAWLEDEAADLNAARDASEGVDQPTPRSPVPPSPPPPAIKDEPKLDIDSGQLILETVVPQVDLFHTKLPQKVDEQGQPLPSYHEVNVMAQVRPKAPETRATGLCIYMLLDTFGQVEDGGGGKGNKISSVFDLLCLLVRIVGLRPIDKVGVIVWRDRRPVRSELIPMTDEGQAQLIEEIKAMTPVGNHRGSPGSSVVEGLQEALEGLEGVQAASSVEVIVCSDGFDATGATHYTNWQQFNSMRDQLGKLREKLARSVRIHSFALGHLSERFLLRAISKVGEGDFSYADATQDGLSVLRSWFLRHIANQTSKVATGVHMQVQCAPGVRLRQMASYEMVFDPTYVHQHSKDPDSGSMQIEDFSADHTTNVIMTLGIREDIIQKGTTDLMTVTVTYREGQTGQHRSVSSVAQQEASSDLISREHHDWLPAAYVTRVEGAAMLSGTGGGRGLRLLAGDVLDTRDCVEAGRGARIFLMAADDTRLVLSERSAVVIKSLEPGELKSSFSLTKGSVFVVTGQEAEAEVVVMEPRFSITVTSASYCKVEFDPRSRLVKLNCMSGRATVRTQKEDGDVLKTAEVLALQQTQMTDKQAPLPPWAIEEESYREWLTADALNSNFLQFQVSMGAQICRTVVAEWVGRASQWLYKGSWDRLTEPLGNKRCREFLIRFWLNESKHFLTNNIAGLAPETEVIRKYVDKAIAIAMGDKAKSRDRNNLYYLSSAAASLASERARGLCDVFVTPLQQRLFIECADAKAKEEREREAAERDRQRLLKDSETQRREKELKTLFPLCDLEGMGSVYYSSVIQVIAGLEYAVERTDSSPAAKALEPAASKVLTRWADVAKARQLLIVRDDEARRWKIPGGPTCNPDVTGSMALGEKDFVRLWLSLAEEVEGAGFNMLMRFVHFTMEDINLRNEATRRGRATFALFRKWDTEGGGLLPLADLEEVLHTSFCGRPHFAACWARCLAAIPTLPPIPTATERDPTESEVEREKTSGEPKEEQVLTPRRSSEVSHGTLKVDLRRFHLGIAAFFEGFSERAFHRAVEELAGHLATRRSSHRTITRVVKQMSRQAEKDQLLQWDLRHVFDGVTLRDLSKLSRIEKPAQGQFLDHVAAPICILCGLNPIKTIASTFVNTGNDDFTDGWWEVLRSKVARDAGGFVDFLRNFPVLSVSYRQVIRVLRFTSSPDFDSCRLLALCAPLANLCEWVRLVLKIGFLEHEWDFTNVVEHGAQPIPDETQALTVPIVQPAIPSKHSSQANIPAVPSVRLERDDTTQDIVAGTAPTADEAKPAAPEETLMTLPTLPAAALAMPRPDPTTPKPHAGVVLNRAFRGVIQADDPAERATSRFSRYKSCTPDPTAGEAALPDRREPHTPLYLRRQPVAAITSDDGLASTQMFKSPTPDCPTVQAATPSKVGPRPPRQPPRPRTAPLSGRPAPRRQFPAGGPAPPVASREAYMAPSPVPSVRTQVSDFLCEHGLEELIAPMQQDGYDDIVDLRDLAVAQHAEFSKLVPRPGHRAKLARLLGA
eukprot:Hpha_TRINITY_DN11053_c0_g1::TRINITY_DN11053_c0_g1_i1::g.92923::m.92923